MYTLILDTSTEKGFVAFAHNDKIVFEKLLPLKNAKGSSLLFAAISQGFDSLQISLSNVKAVAVAIGPGLFTGIRVAAAASLAIARGSNIPLITFSSLSGFIPEEDGFFASFIDAKVGAAHLLLREKRGNIIHDVSNPEYHTETSLKEKICLCRSIVSPSFGKWNFPQGVESFPNIAFLACEIEKKFSNNSFVKDLELHY